MTWYSGWMAWSSTSNVSSRRPSPHRQQSAGASVMLDADTWQCRSRGLYSRVECMGPLTRSLHTLPVKPEHLDAYRPRVDPNRYRLTVVVMNVYECFLNFFFTKKRVKTVLYFYRAMLCIARSFLYLSVWHTRGLYPHGSTYDHDFFTIW